VALDPAQPDSDGPADDDHEGFLSMLNTERKADAVSPGGRRAKLRAAVIAYFVFFNVLAALPSAGAPTPERLARPFERDELRRWATLFEAVGVHVEPTELAQGYMAFAGAVERARAMVLEPIQWWMSLVQVGQSWRLFAMADDTANALQITAHSGAGGDQVLYESGHPDRRWNAALLEYRRIRAAYNPSRSGPPYTYPGLAKRLGERVFETMPDVERVSVSLLPSQVPLPGQAPVPPREAAHVIELARPAR
jgi:hypothetical protein